MSSYEAEYGTQSERDESSEDEIESSTDPEDEDADNDQDLHETRVNLTVEPVPGFEEVIGDLFQVRERRKKP